MASAQCTNKNNAMVTKKDKKKKKKASIAKSRRRMQVFFAVATFLIGLRHVMPGEGSTGGSFDAFCPMGGVETFLRYLTDSSTLKSTNLLNFSILMGVLGVSLVAGRAFCGWMCPLGTMQDMLAGWARRLSGGKRRIRGKRSKARFPVQVPAKLDHWARYLKYLVLAGVLLASTMTVYPPLYDFCPARAVFGLHWTPLLASVFVTFVVTSMLVQRFWCKYLCPLGALLSIFNKFAPLRIHIDDQRCTLCHRCDVDCPMALTPVQDNMRSLECIQCMECLETCAIPEAVSIKLVTTSTPQKD